ncbi:MAG: malto-oligosyltrehalose trehalohydrolase [Vicinamibacterales bacterium]
MTSSSDASATTRRLPIGAEPQAGGGVHFRVWAPRRQRVSVVVQHAEHLEHLEHEGNGYFSGFDAGAKPGDLYWVTLDDAARFPDPASRFQPEGPHGPSEVIDPSQFSWSDANREWPGLTLEGQVIYEVHVGTYTKEGTFAALERELPEIARAGITVLEIMPVADFPGRFGWGYDGVCLYAPTRLYGRPDDLRRFVDRAHALGLGVILDVVYNHFGPDGNFMREFSDTFFTTRYQIEWGDAINFDGDGSEGVREFVVENAGYWIDEFHLDGLRLDATQSIRDRSKAHILAMIGRRVRDAARGRRTIVVAENEPQRTQLVRPLEAGGYGLDGLWNDDFHHSAIVRLTGRREAYYTDYLGTTQEFISMAKRGFLYQGQRYSWQRKARGTPARGVPRSAFITFLENHDQVANSARGVRLHEQAAPGALRAMTALLLLGPNTPMLFQGQEFAASSRFLFFADHRPDLAKAVREGRAEFLRQFPSLATEAAQARIPAPDDPGTFERCKLDLDERRAHTEPYALHRDLLALRRRDPVFGSPDVDLDGAALGEAAFVLRFFGGADGDRLLVVNLGTELGLEIVNESLLAPPDGARWRVVWSSEDIAYGGSGTPAIERSIGWRLPGLSTIAVASAWEPETK